MPDREKVIKDLEECLSASCRGFRPRLSCPYNDDEWDIMRDALSLLKEQEARIKKHNRFIDGFSREAVPVVRCKDCKNGGMDSTSYPHYWCTRHTEYVRENYFCADGEHKEQEGEA